MLRTHLAGELHKETAGQTVTLTGWVARRRDHGGVIFIDLRDSSGIAQVVFRDPTVAETAHHLRSEFCIKVTGVVEARPAGSENPNLASGDIEVNVTELDVLNEAAALPFQIDDTAKGGEVGEETRLKYRWTCADPLKVAPSGCVRKLIRRRAGCWKSMILWRSKPPP